MQIHCIQMHSMVSWKAWNGGFQCLQTFMNFPMNTPALNIVLKSLQWIFTMMWDFGSCICFHSYGKYIQYGHHGFRWMILKSLKFHFWRFGKHRVDTDMELTPSSKNVDIKHFEHWNFQSKISWADFQFYWIFNPGDLKQKNLQVCWVQSSIYLSKTKHFSSMIELNKMSCHP